MSLYPILPNKPRTQSTEPFITWKDAFTSEEIEKIIKLCDNLEQSDAQVGNDGDGKILPEIRRTKISWLKNKEDANWIYDRLAWISRSINSDFYRFNLYGFVEDIQYTVYNDSDEGHYTWHIDLGPKTEVSRKLSIVVQLSDPDEYEGGELEIMTGSEPTSVLKQKGLVAAFPSYTLHRVTPVTKGTRRTLVVWVAGPDFV